MLEYEYQTIFHLQIKVDWMFQIVFVLPERVCVCVCVFMSSRY